MFGFRNKKRYQQGDILFESIGKIPRKAKKTERRDGKLIIAEGEVSGHLHAIEAKEAELFDNDSLTDDIEKFLKIEKGNTVEITHPEHDNIILPPGKYSVSRVREMKHNLDEYRPSITRHVFD